ncbi:endonuclease [Ferrimonas futtsuensis]|uniref:endonuclease n=1 Tax=Ferrimonas futtsuensis TaxID=364764 RepID=UPI000422316D|nr:endonuclease [Ferrimonas futtsuensis]
MKQLIGLSGALLLLSGAVQAQIDNGDFETWSSGTPQGWTTIDSGIRLSQSSAFATTGNSSAQVEVLTGTQSNTDFRQSISVTAGVPIEVSVDLYHTEGNVKARLYVGTYQGYSNPALIGQWQTLSHSHTPSSSGSIEVGLRFYDESGFDGNEIVYVDNFRPRNDSTPVPGCSDTEATLALTTDGYGSETSWSLINAQDTELYSGNGYGNNEQVTETFCLADDDYRFTINDSYGDGLLGSAGYRIEIGGQVVVQGSQFTYSQSSSFTVGTGGGDNGGGDNGGATNLEAYYLSAEGLTGYPLKSELHNIIKGHSSQGYTALWQFYQANELDNYYENDGSILDIYSEKPASGDSVHFSAGQDQCGSYSREGDCYNREHSFPKSWFGGKVEPMNSDVHHIFATDGYVNAKRSNYPYGEVVSASYTSGNGSKLGTDASGRTLFEPIDEFKGDLARAYFYMATRYQDKIAGWESNTSNSDLVLDGSADRVFEPWLLALLKTWHLQDPVSQKERDRNQAAFDHQGNRNPFVDHPEFVEMIW